MSLFRRFFQWLLLKPVEPAAFADPEFVQLDIDKIAAEIRLEHEARRLGSANLPSSNDTEMTGLESLIVRRVEKARQDYLAWAADQLKLLNQEIERRDITPLVNHALQADREFERHASSLLSQHEQVLGELSSGARQADSELYAFKARHGLTRQAVYPDQAGTFFRISLLVLLIVAEGALNAVFFAQGVSTGLLGGFLYAAAFAFANVAFASLWGRWLLPNINHRNYARRIVGVVAVPGALATALAVGLLIAHFRDALGRDAADAAALAINTLHADPFELKEIHSWLLLGVSLLFALIAMVDSYGLDDPYPGYGKADRRRVQALEDYGLELDGLRIELENLKNQSITDLERAVTAAQTNLEALHQGIEHKQAVESRLRHAAADADNCLDTLLRSFRDNNRLHRSSPSPRYFSERPDLAQLPWPRFQIDRDRAKYRVQSGLRSQLLERLETIRGSIQSSFVRHRQSVQPLELQFERFCGGKSR